VTRIAELNQPVRVGINPPIAAHKPTIDFLRFLEAPGFGEKPHRIRFKRLTESCSVTCTNHCLAPTVITRLGTSAFGNNQPSMKANCQ
jgi:hypothetical protein